MEHISFEGVDLAELLPRIPDSVKDGLPFGLVKLDLTGKVLEYNMAEGDLTGVSPAWAIGKNFFDEVAVCTKTANFYGRFVEGVKKGFINTVFDYTFDHREEATKVKVHMVTVPDHLGRKNVMILVKRSSKPLVMNAITADPVIPTGYSENYPEPTRPASMEQSYSAPAAAPAAPVAAAASAPSIQDIVAAVLAVMNQGTPIANTAAVAQSMASASQNQSPAPAPVAAPAAAPGAPAGKSRIEDILKF
jgi:photoactive yellow protein